MNPAESSSGAVKMDDAHQKPADAAAAGASTTTPSVPAPLVLDDEREGVVPIFIVGATQELFGLRTDVDITLQDPWRLLPKKQLLEDIKFRGVISDFQRHKQLIADFPGEDFLMVYDKDGKYGDNFYLVSSMKRYQWEMDQRDRRLFPEKYVVVPAEPEPTVADTASRPRGWISQGSDLEIVDARIVPDRNAPITMYFSRQRRFFGRSKDPYDDRDALDADFTEFRPFKDPNFELRRKELDKGMQGVQMLADSESQTNFHRMVPAIQQVSEAVMVQLASGDLQQKVAGDLAAAWASDRGYALRWRLLEQMVRTNCTMDVFDDEFLHLDDDESGGHGAGGVKRGAVQLKEQLSFTHIEYSKGRRLSRVQWHPYLRGTVGVSTANAAGFDTRVLTYGFVRTSYVLVWSTADSILPKCVLECFSDVCTFSFCPAAMAAQTLPGAGGSAAGALPGGTTAASAASASGSVAGSIGWVAAGCSNGQVVLWDLSAISPAGKKALRVPITAVSTIEQSHSAAVSDLQWSSDGSHFVTTGYDSMLFVWDRKGVAETVASLAARKQSGPAAASSQDKQPARRRGGGADGAEEDDGARVVFQPILKVFLAPIDRGGRLTCTSILLNTPGHRMSKYGSAAGGVSGEATCWGASEEGELFYADWCTSGDQGAGKDKDLDADGDGHASAAHSMSLAAKEAKKQRKDVVRFVRRPHVASVIGVLRSPFVPDLILTFGDWRWSLWRNDTQLFTSPYASSPLSAAAFSPSRPSVIFTGTIDGRVEVWDLLDRTHEPLLTQTICSNRVTSIAFPAANTAAGSAVVVDTSSTGSKAPGTIVACGDDSGTLRLFEVPRTFSRKISREDHWFNLLLQREAERSAYVLVRASVRDKEGDEKKTLLDEAATRQQQQPSQSSSSQQQQASAAKDPLEEKLEQGFRLLQEEFLKMLPQDASSRAPSSPSST